MPNARIDLKTVDPREVFPWVHLFRGFRLALDPKKLVLGALGALLMSAGWWAIGSLATGEAVSTPPKAEAGADTLDTKQDLDRYVRERNEALEYARRLPWRGPPEGEVDPFRSPFVPGGIRDNIPTATLLVIEPLRRIVFAATLMFRNTTSTLVGGLLTIWTLLVWALCGGAITRIAAVQIAREGQVGLGGALRFVLGRYFSYVGAPVLPFVGVVIIVALSFLAGLMTWIPFLDVVMGALWFLPLLAGIVMAIALLGLALGWPLMYAAISAEATESFDALSRSYSYLLEKPWHYFFYALVALIYGGILTTFVVTVGFVVLSLSQYAVSWGGGTANLEQLYAYVPLAGGWREAFGPRGEVAGPTGTQFYAALGVGVWTHLVFLAILGFAYSYFWSAATIIYFLLRGDVDETEFDEVFIEEAEDEPFPTVNPSLGPANLPASGPAAGQAAPAAGGFSLPIIDPPR